MKKTISLLFFSAFLFHVARSQSPANWTKEQLMEPAELATTLNSGKNLPLIYSVGPGALIPHSVALGTGRDKENIDALKKQLQGHAKDESIVIYCGCCPFEHCPNVRPAIDALKELQFTNYKLLDLSHNIKTDWIDKGYPTVKKTENQ